MASATTSLEEQTATLPEAEAPDAAARAGAAKAPAKSRKPLVFGVVVAAVALGVVGWEVAHRGLESTDDAQVDIDIVSVPARTSATVLKVNFVENQKVKMGDLLAELDPEQNAARLAQADANLLAAQANADAADADARVAETNARGSKSVAQASLQGASSSAVVTREQVTEAEAQVASATATLQRATLDHDRAVRLAATGAIAQAQMDQSQSTFDTATAALAQAKAHVASLKASISQANSQVQVASAKLDQARDVDVIIAQAHAKAQAAHAQVAMLKASRDLAALDLGYTKIYAPEAGTVSKKTIVVGQMVQPGQAVVQLVPSRNAWITGNFKETQVGKMQVGNHAKIELDAYPGRVFHGEVESLSSATGARFSLLPPDNATGNYTKIVQRVPVRVRVTDAPADVAFRPGMSVELEVDTGK